MVRLVRASVLVEKNKNYTMASKSFGASWFRIYFINVLPNCFAPILVQATFGLSDAILNTAALGFLGLGVQPPSPDWGRMVNEARESYARTPWALWYPAAAIAVLVIGVNLLADGLRRIFRYEGS